MNSYRVHINSKVLMIFIFELIQFFFLIIINITLLIGFFYYSGYYLTLVCGCECKYIAKYVYVLNKFK